MMTLDNQCACILTIILSNLIHCILIADSIQNYITEIITNFFLSSDISDFHYGPITMECAEALCRGFGEFLIRTGRSSDSDLRLTVKKRTHHAHFTIYKDNHVSDASFQWHLKVSLFFRIVTNYNFFCYSPGHLIS